MSWRNILWGPGPRPARKPRPAPDPGQLLRGKISRNSVIKGGELSVVIRFGIEEAARVKDLTPGTLVMIQPEEQAK